MGRLQYPFRKKSKAEVEAVWVALIVAVAAMVGPLLLSRLNSRQQAAAAKLLLAENARVAQKLDVIHTLVNSTLTAAIEAQLEATVQQLAMMQRVLAGDTRAPSPESVLAIEAKINEMRAALNDRLTADAQTMVTNV